ncbi:MAG TPA: ATPase domain-containing protein [Vicinamibacterales bacterium]|jgi:circadian clock protein KaiC|nr:ATPase domain-containing protein [Vicinamibacterales bacterium]
MTDQRNAGDLVATGIAGLDPLFFGGIRRGNLVLVKGEPGSGKTLLGTEFIYRGATQFGEPGLIVVFESNPMLLRRDAAAFGWDLEALERQNTLKIIATSPQVLDQELRGTDGVLLQTAREMGARRIFIDNVALLGAASAHNDRSTNGNGTGSPREMFQHLLEGLRREELTGLVAHETSTHVNAVLTLESAEILADTVIHLHRGRHERGVFRRIEITKSRGQPFDEGEHTLHISDGKGLEVFRRVQSDVRERLTQPASDLRRSAVGMEAIDQLSGGGLYVGSVSLIIGNSGSGKSILAYQLAAEGAEKLGKRALLVSSDEHPAQILRNADTLGLPLRSQVESGAVQLLHVSPLEVEVDVLYATICRAVEERAAERLVLDGVTAIANALHDERRFREFMHGLMAFTKQRLLTTFICYEHPEIFGVTRFMPDNGISSIVDNIVLLTFVELGDRMRRAMLVAKARGSAHALATREYTIGPGGITVLPEGPDMLPLPSFRTYLGLLSRAPTRVDAEVSKRRPRSDMPVNE